MAYLDHIGIAVKDLPQMKTLFQILGLQDGGTERVPDQKVMTHFLELPQGKTQIELLEPEDEEGPIAKYIQKQQKGGIHHLSFRVEKGELPSLMEKLRKHDYRLIYEQPQAGAHDMRVNFIHPKTTGGILVEIMEPA